MPPTAQTFDSDDRAAFKRLDGAVYSRPGRLFASACFRLAVLGAPLLLAACGAGGFTLDKMDVDRSIVTGSVTSAPSPQDPDMASDQSTIRNAVSSVDVEELGGKPVPWANSETGSRGSVTNLVQTGEKGSYCRAFSVSRERFDGVSMYKGQACMSDAGDWRLDNFTAL